MDESFNINEKLYRAVYPPEVMQISCHALQGGVWGLEKYSFFATHHTFLSVI